MPRERIVDFLPAHYRHFLPAFFDRPLTEERHATCHACVMCPPPVPDLPPDAYFSPSTKCCTYHPTLPNYAVGGLLLDESEAGAEGRRRIQKKIADRIGVTPFGIAPPARQQLLYAHGRAAFGRSNAMVCPYLDRDRGACTVWAQRESQCATWFCKHNNGEDGRQFWTSLRNYLFETQRLLTSYALAELGFPSASILAGPPTTSELDARDLDDRPPRDEVYAAAWGEWLRREDELYISTARIVGALDRESYERIAGLPHRLLLDSLAARHRAIAEPRLPDPMIKNPEMRIDRGADGSYVLTSYRNGEPTRLQKAIFDLLDLFDGRRSNAEVRAVVRGLTGLGVADSFLISLYQHRILIDAAGARYRT